MWYSIPRLIDRVEYRVLHVCTYCFKLARGMTIATRVKAWWGSTQHGGSSTLMAEYRHIGEGFCPCYSLLPMTAWFNQSLLTYRIWIRSRLGLACFLYGLSWTNCLYAICLALIVHMYKTWSFLACNLIFEWNFIWSKKKEKKLTK